MSDVTSKTLASPTAAEQPAVPDLSVVIPVHNESGAILPLLKEVDQVMEESLVYEVIVVDDGSTDGTREVLQAAADLLPRLTVIRHRHRSGQSAGLLTGIRAAQASWIATLDGDGQNDPADLPRLWLHHLDHPDLLMVCGIRNRRQDSFSKRLASRVANGLRRRVLRDGMEDTGCGLKLFQRKLYLSFPPFDHMHRFLPALAHAKGVGLDTVDVGHRPREAGRSKYGILDRAAEGIVDLAGVWWLTRRRLDPKLSSE